MKTLLATIGLGLALLGGAGGWSALRSLGAAAYAGDVSAPAQVEESADRAVVSAISKHPKTWIGVRLTPAPAALAAHLSRAGVMIANVVRDGPADRAGVQQYDVVVSFDGQSVTSLQDLADAIATAGPGARAELLILRKGAEHRMTITPEPRPEVETVDYKYEEPQAEAPDDYTRYFGHRLQRDPAGNWVLEPLGRMDDLPGNVKGMLQDIPGWRGMLGLDPADPFQMQLDPGDDPAGAGAGWRFFAPDDDTSSSVSVDIQVNDNGAQVGVMRQPDGTVEVTREENGQKSSARYDSLDDLRAADPDAYETYRRYSGYRAAPMITVPPTLRNLPDLQWDFQRKIEQQLQQARQKARAALDKAGDATRAIRSQLRASGSPGATVQTDESISVEVNNGRITIDIDSAGDHRHYEFDSIEQLKADKPDVYEKVRGLFGDPLPDGS